jgi:hypothetical protein
MKRLVLTLLSMAAVCAVISATPAAAQDTVTGAPRGTAPVTVEGYGTSIAPQTLPGLIARAFAVGLPALFNTPARPLPQSARLRAALPPQSPDPERGNSQGDYRGIP